MIGYGPTGVTAAIGLGSLGISTVALERDRDIYPRARAVTVNDWTMRIFQAMDVGESIERLVERMRALRWITYDGKEIMRQEFPPSALGSPGGARFYNIYQPTMEAALREEAGRFGARAAVRYGVEVVDVEQDAAGVTVIAKNLATGEATNVRARYAIAADGGGSTTRRRLGIRLLGDTQETEWVIIDCRAKRWWPDRNLLTFWSDREHPVVDIMLAGGNHRWEIPLEPTECPEDYPTAAEVWPLLHRMGVTEEDVEIRQHAFYKHHLRSADRWRVGRVFLAGDAAHLMPPWAGSGMQTGIRDAWDLAWKLAGVLKGQLPEAVLDSYAAERKPNADFYTHLSVELGKIIKQELSEEELAAMAPPELPEGAEPPEAPLIAPPVLAGGWLRGPLGEESIVGRMVPQPLVSTPNGVFRRLDDLLGHHFVLLGDGVDPRTLLSKSERAEWEALGARFLAVRPVTESSEGEDELVDLEGVLGAWLRKYDVRAVAVRPDRFVAAADVSGLAVPELPVQAAPESAVVAPDNDQLASAVGRAERQTR
ncbi:MAG: FAD-dependent monooxygenase [Candidatus Dormibacteraeota bacterium]|nr:FAD-dependent monooxygenase [Candidatus Dormibacteraeota bacterium]